MKLNIKKLDILLATHCLSFAELSQRSGVSSMTLSKLKKGSLARPRTIGMIAKALEVEVTELIE